MFGDCDARIWLSTTFIYNPFINLFMISESLFAMCPSDNFFNQEAFLSLLIESKLANCAPEAESRISKIRIGDRVSVEEYVLHAKMDEFYCVCLLILSRLNCRRKIRFIQIGDCYSVTSDETMKRLFNVMYCGGENSSSKLADCENDTIDSIRKEYLKFSCEYGAKYKSSINLSFDSVECYTFNIDKILDTNKFINNTYASNNYGNTLSTLIDIPIEIDDITVAEILPRIILSVDVDQRLNLSISLLPFIKCSALHFVLPNKVQSDNMCNQPNEILNNRIRIFKFNPHDIKLWILGSYFATYYKEAHLSLLNHLVLKTHNSHRDNYLTDGSLMLTFNSVCQPIAPVDSENEFYTLIYSCVVTDVLTEMVNSMNSSESKLKKLCCVIPVCFDLKKEYWLQIACFLKNIGFLLSTVGTISFKNTAFCNSNYQPFSFDMVISFPGSIAQTPSSNFSSFNEQNGVPCGDVLIVNPFSYDLFFWVADQPTKNLLVLSRYSFMQVNGGVKFGLCSNNTCETMVYFKSLILPESKRYNRQRHFKNDKILLSDTKFRNLSAVIRFHAFDDLMNSTSTDTVISVPICPYKCTNFLCCNQERNCYFHYPFCDACLRIHMKMDRKYINKIEGYGLFTLAPVEEGSTILCEIISNSFYELISSNELKIRYGSFAMKNPNSVPYVNEIKLPDGGVVYLDQTIRRGLSSLINTASNFQNEGNSEHLPNCVMHFEATEQCILLKVTTTKSVLINDELRLLDTGSSIATISNAFGVVVKRGKYCVEYDSDFK
jgi:hypothetical protein